MTRQTTRYDVISHQMIYAIQPELIVIIVATIPLNRVKIEILLEIYTKCLKIFAHIKSDCKCSERGGEGFLSPIIRFSVFLRKNILESLIPEFLDSWDKKDGTPESCKVYSDNLYRMMTF